MNGNYDKNEIFDKIFYNPLDNIEAIPIYINSVKEGESSIEGENENYDKIFDKIFYNPLDNIEAIPTDNNSFKEGESSIEGQNNTFEREENEPKNQILLFNVEKQDKYRGRKRKRIIPLKLHFEPFFHNKYVCDNLLRKVQVHYMNFIIDYSNSILKKYGYKKEDFFVAIDYKFKRNVKKDNVNLLKESDIGYVLCQNICSKFKNKENSNNIKIFQKVTKNEIIKYLLSENYLQLFKNVYHKNERIFSFKIRDYSDIIDLTSTKMFEDLLKKKGNEKKDYREKLKEIVYINYIK